MQKYIFILGRDPELSQKELFSYLEARKIQYLVLDSSKVALILQIKDISPEKLIKDLGGTQKIARVIDSFDNLYMGTKNKVRYAISKYSADTTRLTMLNGGEDMDDPNWDNNFASSLLPKFNQLYEFYKENYNKGTNDYSDPEELFESQINLNIKQATGAMEQTRFRTAIQKSYFDMQKSLRQYLKKVEKPNKKLMNLYIETQIKMLSPFVPFITEESWSSLGKKTLISLERS